MLRQIIAGSVLGLATTAAAADTFVIDWLDMSPTPFGSSVPNNSNYILPGLGAVNVSYTIPSVYNHARTTNPSLQNGSVVSGPDTWNWTDHELFAATPVSATAATSWNITFTFASTVSPGQIYLGVAGLGATTQSPSGAGATVATVLQNGTFLADYAGSPANNWGPTLFTPGPGVFTMQNSLAAPGGADPHWNSQLGIVRIDDAISSLTVRFDQLPGDGVGVNIGYVPAPAAATTLALAGLTLSRRRR